MRVAVLNIVGLSPSVFARRKCPRLQEFARASGGIRTLTTDLPAVTCSVQSSMLTGTRPAQHGIVGNGWFDRELQEVHFWKQSNRLVRGPMVWDTLRERARGRPSGPDGRQQLLVVQHGLGGRRGRHASPAVPRPRARRPRRSACPSPRPRQPA